MKSVPASLISPAKWNKKECLFSDIVIRIKWDNKYVKNTLYAIKCYRHYCKYIMVVVLAVSVSDIWKQFLERNFSTDDYCDLPSCKNSQPLAWKQSQRLPQLPLSFLNRLPPTNLISDLRNSIIIIISVDSKNKQTNKQSHFWMLEYKVLLGQNKALPRVI